MGRFWSLTSRLRKKRFKTTLGLFRYHSLLLEVVTNCDQYKDDGGTWSHFATTSTIPFDLHLFNVPKRLSHLFKKTQVHCPFYPNVCDSPREGNRDVFVPVAESSRTVRCPIHCPMQSTNKKSRHNSRRICNGVKSNLSQIATECVASRRAKAGRAYRTCRFIGLGSRCVIGTSVGITCERLDSTNLIGWKGVAIPAEIRHFFLPFL